MAVPSPEGAVQLSPGREPWVNRMRQPPAPEGRHTPSVSPLRGWNQFWAEYPGLAPWANLCRPFGATKYSTDNPPRGTGVRATRCRQAERQRFPTSPWLEEAARFALG